MSDNQALIQAWLRGEHGLVPNDQFVWDPGFDAERCVVVSKLGFHNRVFEKPVNFEPRFYQKVVALPIAQWSLSIDHRLYGGFCALKADLQIYFQASLVYAQSNRGVIAELNRHIKTTYESVINDLVKTELNQLKDAEWVQQGLAEVERKIASGINETLLLRHVQARTQCELTPHFALTATDTLEGRFAQDAVYHKVMQKDFEFREKQALDQFKQAEQLEQIRLEHAKKQLEVIQQEDEIQRQKRALEAELAKKKLAELELQREQQHEIEVRLERDNARYEKELKAIELASALEFEKEKLVLEQQLELQKLDQQLAHEQVLKSKRGFEESATLAQQQKAEQLEQEKALQRKRLDLEIQLKEEEAEQIKRQKLAEKLAALKIEHDFKINKMNLEAEVKALELRAETLKSKDDFLHKEIEWLVLDKQRAEMTRLTQENN